VAGVADLIVARLSREDVAGLIPHEAEVDVAALRDELVVCDNRKRGAAQVFARGGIEEAQLETITAELVHRMAEIRADLNAATSHSPLSAFALTDDSRRTWGSCRAAESGRIARILLTVTLPPLGRGHSFNRDLIQKSGTTPAAPGQRSRAAPVLVAGLVTGD
jgi:site-specific DNA recombinase